MALQPKFEQRVGDEIHPALQQITNGIAISPRENRHSADMQRRARSLSQKPRRRRPRAQRSQSVADRLSISISRGSFSFNAFGAPVYQSNGSERRQSIVCPICSPNGGEWYQCRHGTEDSDEDEDPDPDVKHLKVVIVGESCVGKTSLAYRFARDEFPGDYAPTICDNFSVKLRKGSKRVFMDIWDTAGQEDYDRLRSLSYRNTDVFIICFSIDNQQSFEKIQDRWIPELYHYTRGVPALILVGTKADLRYSKQQRDVFTKHFSPKKKFISSSKAYDLKTKIGAVHYAECSALQNKNVNEIFHTVINATFQKKSKARHKECVIL